VLGGRPALRSGVFLANLRASPRCLLADGHGCYRLRQVWSVLPRPEERAPTGLRPRSPRWWTNRLRDALLCSRRRDVPELYRRVAVQPPSTTTIGEEPSTTTE
jgi:hypothetical protein